MPIVDIRDDGDVILVVGPEEHRLRVYSRVMMSGSHVFDAMMGRSFSEGQKLGDHKSPKDIPLPDDDARIMELICYVLHHRPAKVYEAMTVPELANLAIAVDKYQCIQAFMPMFLQSMRVLKPTDSTGIAQKLVAAYLMNAGESFEKVSRALVLEHKGSFLTLLETETVDRLPELLFCFLEQRRSHMQAALQSKIQRLSNGFECQDPSNNGPCTWLQANLVEHIDQLQALDISIFNSNPHNSLMDCISRIADMEVHTFPHGQCHPSLHKVPDFERQHELVLAELRAVPGLCLACVNAGRAEMQESCRRGHTIEERIEAGLNPRP